MLDQIRVSMRSRNRPDDERSLKLQPFKAAESENSP